MNLKKDFENVLNSEDVYYIAKLFKLTKPASATNQYSKAKCVTYNSM